MTWNQVTFKFFGSWISFWSPQKRDCLHASCKVSHYITEMMNELTITETFPWKLRTSLIDRGVGHDRGKISLNSVSKGARVVKMVWYVDGVDGEAMSAQTMALSINCFSKAAFGKVNNAFFWSRLNRTVVSSRTWFMFFFRWK